MALPMNGTVTPLSSMFPSEEAHKASQRVHDAIAERQKELDTLHGFVSDNSNLVNLVHRLPEDLHHDVMVPFGKAAFFPGRLIHTNEFLVLLGEGYYADRTSKQTTEILKRRGKSLESHINSLKAVMQDLKAQASFFDSTAMEAAGDLVEIREDLEEESAPEMEPISGSRILDNPSSGVDNKINVDDDEYARMMTRLAELEQEELAAESGHLHDGDGQTKADLGHASSQSLPRDSESSEEQLLVSKSRHFADEHECDVVKKNGSKKQPDLCDQFENLMSQPATTDVISHQKHSVAAIRSSPTDEALAAPKPKENVQLVSTSCNEDPSKTKTSNAHYGSLKAFPGSIVEHAHGLDTKSREQHPVPSQLANSQPSKPVSRFKMQRR